MTFVFLIIIKSIIFLTFLNLIFLKDFSEKFIFLYPWLSPNVFLYTIFTIIILDKDVSNKNKENVEKINHAIQWFVICSSINDSNSLEHALLLFNTLFMLSIRSLLQLNNTDRCQLFILLCKQPVIKNYQ